MPTKITAVGNTGNILPVEKISAQELVGQTSCLSKIKKEKKQEANKITKGNKDKVDIKPVPQGTAQPKVEIQESSKTEPKHFNVTLETGITKDGLTITDPMGDSRTNTKTIDGINSLIGSSFDLLTKKYPKLDKNVLYRIAEAGTYSMITASLMVWSHEGGHYNLAQKYGFDPSIEMNSPYSGLTHYNVPDNIDHKTWLEMKGNLAPAGMNQIEFNTQHIYEKMYLNDPKYYDAISYFVNQIHDSLYIGRSMYLEKKGIAPSYDDNVAYSKAMTEQGMPMKTSDALLPSLLTNILSANTWNSLWGAVRYLTTGEKNMNLWTFKVGKVEITPPNFSYFRNSKGEAIESIFFINPKGNYPIKLSFASDLDFRGFNTNLDTFRVGGQVYNLKIPYSFMKNVSFSPYGYINTTHEMKPKGFLVGTGIEVPVNKWMSITGDVGYAYNDLIKSDLQKSNGLNTYLGTKFYF